MFSVTTDMILSSDEHTAKRLKGKALEQTKEYKLHATIVDTSPNGDAIVLLNGTRTNLLAYADKIMGGDSPYLFEEQMKNGPQRPQ